MNLENTLTMNPSEEVRHEEIHTFLEHFSKNTFKVKGDGKTDPVTERCMKLFSKDYQFSVINNINGDLCGTYPNKLVLLEYEKSTDVREKVESIYDVNKVRELIKQSRFARCRSRFAAPVILYEGKHICRSATLSSGAEMYSRSGLDFFFTDDLRNRCGKRRNCSRINLLVGGEQNNGLTSKTPSTDQRDMHDRLRGQDISLLQTYSIKYIVDLMVEKKKVKFMMNVTSSEKVDKENRYGEFCIVSVPYPGCEFFKEWKDNSYLGEDMKFDWKQGYVDACLDIPPTEVLRQLNMNWSQYQRWNLIELTGNYLKMLIHLVTENDKGILVHCISGWDRTPMFISLLRLSLWADGAIHKSLSATEILYLTLAYDWYLFGHNLSDRLSKGEEIMLFCFYFLQHITADEFSVSNKRPRCSSTNVNNSLNTNDTSGRTASRSSSVSSMGSFTVEPQNSVFYLNNEEDTTSNGADVQSGRHTSGGSASHQSGPSTRGSMSSPVNVPFNRTRQPSVAESLDCGSWQVITKTGSLLGADTSCQTTTKSSANSCEEATETICTSQRQEKLDVVRRMFYNAYNHKISGKLKSDNGITNLFDQFAVKVGFQPLKSFR